MECADYSLRFRFPGYLRVALLCATQWIAFSQLAPECYPGGHWTLRNPYRSVDFDSTEIQNTAIQDLICDHSLAPGWYRFSINNKPAEMPTSCVEMNRCGTQAPVWLSLKDGSLPRPGEVRQLSACATWQFFQGSTKDCCLFRIPITVRNCGEFLLYNLQPTQGCMGYCAKATPDFAPRLCPPGEVEVNGRCKASVPTLSSRPVITPELVDSSVHLRCSFARVASSQAVGYQVVWARHISHSMKAEIRQESTMKTFSLVEMDGVHFRLGETFSCSVSTFRANYSHSRSTAKESTSFYAGLKFSADTLQISENSKEHKVSILSTVPIPCPRPQSGPECGVPLVLSVHDPDSLGHEAPNVALSDCQLELRPSGPCTDGDCGRGTFTLTAVTDFTRDGNRPSLVSAVPGPGAPRLWRNHVPNALKVMVQDLPTSVCYSLTDPHVITLDGRRYENQQTGTFVLFQSLSRRFEVHSRQWDCGGRHYTVACTCGVAVREENEVAVLDMCDGQLQETRPRLTLKNLGAAKGNRRLRVLETHQGKKITLIFPSGAFVRADVSDWGMSLSVRAPGLDYGNTRGLCGTFDRNVRNDFHGSDGMPYRGEEVERFIEAWRIAPGESLFDKTPAGTRQASRRPFCQCREGYSVFPESSSGGTQNLFASQSAHSNCIAHHDVDYTSVFPSMDTTLEYIKSSRPDEGILDTSAFHSPPLESPRPPPYQEDEAELDSEFRKDLLLSVQRQRRQTRHESQPIFMAQNLSQAHLENFAYFFPEDHQAFARPEVKPRWPTPSGLTSAKALEVCQMALANSSVGTACRELLGRRLDEAVDLCILDLQLKDDLGWDEALLPHLENECERRLLENRTRRAQEQPGSAEAPGEVLTALRCPNICNGNGQCTEWGCQCFPSHSFYDCSLAISQPVELTDLESSGLCDIRVFDCSSIRVFGLGFIDSPDLSCHATRLKLINGAWVPREKMRTKATFLSSKALDCGVPSLSSTAVHNEDFMMDDKPYARWEMRVTNDGSQFSEAKVLTLYDGMCQQCEASHSGLCKLKERTCNIEGMCFVEGDSNPSSPCLLCDPDTAKFSWSLNQVNEPPTFLRPQSELRTFAGENFVFQLAASDPEGSALLFQLEEGPQRATLSPAGLLLWRVQPDEKRTRTVRFTLSDECSAQSTYTVELEVVPCGCQNGGSCVTDVSFPAGSGKFLCSCPGGWMGDLCEDDVDECVSAPCSAGTCINTASSYRCECPLGLRGANCMEDVNECERKPCFPGVQCLNSYGSYSCRPCPSGMLGNGTTCTAAPIVPSATSAPGLTVYKVPDVIPNQLKTKSDNFRKVPSARSWHTRLQTTKEIPGTPLDPSHTKIYTPRKSPGLLSDRKANVSPGTAPDRSQSKIGARKGVLGISPDTSDKSVGASEYIPGITPQSSPKQSSTSENAEGNSAVAKERPAAEMARSAVAAINVSSTCASRPCFQGVLCINRRPPHVGYVCGRCPPGLHGNGRICTKDSKAAAINLQQTLAKSSRSPSGGVKVSQLHLPSLPARHGIKHLSSSITRAGTAERGAGTGRREAGSPAFGNVPRSPYGGSGGTRLTTNSRAAKARMQAKVNVQTSVTGPRETVATPQPDVSKNFAGVGGSTTGSKSGAPTQPPPGHRPHPLLSHKTTTPAKPWTPPRPAAPLTAALTELSYSISESEFSADGMTEPEFEEEGEEEEDQGPGLFTPALTIAATKGRGARDPPPYGSTVVQLGIRTAMTWTSSCKDSPCFPGVPCEAAEEGGSLCGRCPMGYIGDGRACRAVCRRPCGRNMECAAPNTCRCKQGYTGQDCRTAICQPECVNGGVCAAPGVCDCPRGYHGDNCERALCSSPCQHGGTCTGPQSCSCPYGFVGPHCETMVCSRHCHNGGQCVSPDECQCQPGWTGPSCQTALCRPVCMNGGLCVRPDVCHCPHGFYGLRCQNAVCSPPCKNGGLCMRNNVCSCQEGYTGGRCDKSVCEPMCMNRGRCVGPGICDCPSGWRGRRCDKPTCLQKCLNGGECVGPNACHCAAGWQGMLCQTPLCEQKCLYGSRCVRPNVCACRSTAAASLCSRNLPISRG